MGKSATADAVQQQLSPAQIIALSAACGPKSVSDAKAALPDGAVEQVDFRVHVAGVVTKGHGSSTAGYNQAASCNLATLPIFAEVLARLDIDAPSLRKALRLTANASLKASDGKSIGAELRGQNAELQEVFADLGKQYATKLPEVHIPGSVKAGAVRTQATAALL